LIGSDFHRAGLVTLDVHDDFLAVAAATAAGEAGPLTPSVSRPTGTGSGPYMGRVHRVLKSW